MTKSNNEYIPEVGVPCLYEGEEVEVTGVGKYGWLICRKGCLGEGYVSNQYLNKFSPTKTEAEKRRDEQIAFMNEVCLEFHRKSETGPSIGEVLYEAGWCKPKPLTDEEVEKLWRISGAIQFCSHPTFKNICTHIHSVILGKTES